MAFKKLNESQDIAKYERLISAIAGGTLAYYAFRNLKNKRRRPFAGFSMALGAGMMFNGSLTGRSPMHRIFERAQRRSRLPMSASVEHGKGVKVERTVTINKPAEELFRFWRRFETLPQFLENIEAVTTLDNNQTHWVAKGPAGTSVEWDAVIHNEIPNELIAWRTIGDSDVNHAGTVEFKALPEGRGTEVKVVINYEPPAGKIGVAFASIFGKEPGQQLDEDLRRFKQLMEAGEIPTTQGQPLGEGAGLFEQFTRKK